MGTSKWKTMKEKTTTIMDSREEFDTEQKFHDALLSNKCWTDSDEAFAITILANNLDIWIQKHKQKTQQSPNTLKNKPLLDSQRYMEETQKSVTSGQKREFDSTTRNSLESSNQESANQSSTSS